MSVAAPRLAEETAHGVVLYPPTGVRPCFRLVWRTSAGARRERRVGKRREAAWAAALAQERLLAAEVGDLGERNIGELAEAWVEAHAHKWAETYKVNNESILRLYVLPALKDVRCDQLARADIRDAMGCPPTKRQWEKTRALLSSMLNWGRRKRWLVDGAGLLDDAEWIGDEAREITLAGESADYILPELIPSTAHCVALAVAMSAVRGKKSKHGRNFTPPDYRTLMAYLAAFTGVRQGELLALCGPDLAQGRLLNITRQVQEMTGRGVVVLPPKGHKSRTIVVPCIVEGYPLAQKLSDRADEVGEGLLFPAPKGGHWRASNFDSRAFRSVKEQLGWDEEWSWHSPRHHAATWMLARGVQPKDVSVQLGHASVRTTLDMYVGVTADWRERLLQAL